MDFLKVEVEELHQEMIVGGLYKRLNLVRYFCFTQIYTYDAMSKCLAM